MALKLDYLEKSVTKHAISVSMANVLKRLVSAQQVAKLVPVVYIVLKLALIGAKRVVTR